MNDELSPVAGEHGPYDAESPPPLSFDQWADISAKLAGRTPERRLAILDAQQLPEALWDACDEFWLTTIGLQIAADNLRMAEIYAEKCVAELERRQQAGDGDSSLGGQASDPQALLETAFLTELPDELALPFVGTAGLPGSSSTNEAIEAHPEVGETQLVAAIHPDEALPFGKGTGGHGR
jgi:hypothetical protein